MIFDDLDRGVQKLSALVSLWRKVRCNMRKLSNSVLFLGNFSMVMPQ